MEQTMYPQERKRNKKQEHGTGERAKGKKKGKRKIS